ncbi:hypothetical protein LTR86_004564 [Recurvomyces mirabilis]|nr:hypothetical protein LTR86_004564 [Recurvomyces mirabilis]
MFNRPQWQFDHHNRLYYLVDSINTRIYEDDPRLPPEYRRSSTISELGPVPQYYSQLRSPILSTPYDDYYPGRSWIDEHGHLLHNTFAHNSVAIPSQLALVREASNINPLWSTTTRATPATAVPEPFTDPQVNLESARDPRTGVAVVTATGPKEKITDPELFRAGVTARRALYPTPEGEERLFSTFKRRQRQFFTVGRVFSVCWSEPASDTTTINTLVQNDRSDPGLSANRFGESIFSKVRKFVIIREGKDYCSALPIVSYGGQGVAKPGVTKAEHGLIYTGCTPPPPQRAELATRGERGMRAQSIRVVPDRQEDRLDLMSRIDFAKVHTVHHNLKVAAFGCVHPDSMAALITEFQNVWLLAPMAIAATSDPT